jgi:hypothetical protein
MQPRRSALGARRSALGARIGKSEVGTIGDIGCFSFNGNKVITAGGDGMIVTDNADLAAKCRHLTTLAKLTGRACHGKASKGLIAELHDAGYVELRPGRSWLIPSPALLDHALRLREAGIDIEVSALIRDLLRRRLARVVSDTVKLLVERTGAGFAGNASPDELATALGALRPIARETSGVILAQEVEIALANLMQAGASTSNKTR